MEVIFLHFSSQLSVIFLFVSLQFVYFFCTYREHLDYFGVAATAYLLLFSSYMDIVKVV